MDLINEIAELFNQNITVYAFVGQSGTGKSFRSKILARKYKIHAIIDDGLLIQDDKILAGTSAKMAENYMGAVRAALFDDKNHRDDVVKALKKAHIKRLMILGTSEKMVNKIAIRLQIPQPLKYIHIEDIATKEEIEKAVRSRNIEGKHVIPAPASEVKNKTSKIFKDAIKVFWSKEKKVKEATDISDSNQVEKSIVTPKFSMKIRLEISQAVICKIVNDSVREFNESIHIKKLQVKTAARGYKLNLTVDIPQSTQIAEQIDSMKKYVTDNVEKLSGVLIEDFNVLIDKMMPAA